MKDSPSPPPAPDPNQTAQAQTQSNVATALANARLNRVNQNTPWGSINYEQGPVDASGVPTYTSNIQLSPAQQRLLEQQQGMSGQRNTIAQSLLNQVGGRLGQPLDLSHLHPMMDTNRQNYAGAIAQQAPAPVGNSQPPMPGTGGQDVMTLLRNNPQILQTILGAAAGGLMHNPAAGAVGSMVAGSMNKPMAMQQGPQGNQQALFQQFLQWLQTQKGPGQQ